MTTVFDCFMFMSEWPLLTARIHELQDVVDVFVLVEGDRTHTGNEKPFTYRDECVAMLSPELRAKVLSRQILLPPHGREPWFGWGREITQRSAINEILKDLGAKDDDIVITGDVDEIPRLRVLTEYWHRLDICSIEERTFHYNLNTELERPTLDPKICRYRDVREKGVSDMRYLHQNVPLHTIREGGWHLSFMGGTEKVIEKIRSYAHYDIRDPRMEEYASRENVERSAKERKSLFQRDDIQYRAVPLSNDLPKYIAENLDLFRRLGWIVEGQ